MANIADFKSQMIGGGARPNQFRAELTFPSFVTLGAVAGQRAQFLCKAAQLPASTIETIPVLFKGRPVNSLVNVHSNHGLLQSITILLSVSVMHWNNGNLVSRTMTLLMVVLILLTIKLTCLSTN